jgi:hypothetical protein
MGFSFELVPAATAMMAIVEMVIAAITRPQCVLRARRTRLGRAVPAR